MFKTSQKITKDINSSQVMFWVAIALLPALIVKTWFYGWGSLIQVVSAIIVGLIVEYLCAKLWYRNNNLSDLSCVVTAIILGLSLAPLAPWYLIVIGMIGAIMVGKMVFGGLGQNIFNPAMVGYAMLLISYPIPMMQWSIPEASQLNFAGWNLAWTSFIDGATHSYQTLAPLYPDLDGFTGATPLVEISNNRSSGDLFDLVENPSYQAKLIASNWQLAGAFVLGGLLLRIKGIIQLHIPLLVIASFAITAWLVKLPDPEADISVILEILLGNIVFCAFFIATDPVTRPQNLKGQYLFAIFIGVMSYLIRYYANYYDGVVFAVLLANLLVPSIESILAYKSRLK